MSKRKIIKVFTVSGSFPLIKGQLNYLRSYFDIVGVSSDSGDLAEIERNECIKIKEINLTRKISPFKDLLALFLLILFLRKEKPDIIHTHTPKAGTIGMIAGKICGVKHRIHTVAGLPLLTINGWKRKLLDFVELVTYSCATKVLPNSHELKRIIIENKYTIPEKLMVIGNGSSNGIDTSFFDFKKVDSNVTADIIKKYSIKDTDFVFIYIGRIVVDKGIVELISAFINFQKKYTGCKLLVLGGFDEIRSKVPDKISRQIIENQNNIIYCGYQHDIRPFLSISNVFVFPSYREGFPNVVMQAGAMGLPSIVSNINGCNEIITNNINGIILERIDIPSIFNAMEKIFLNKEFFLELRSNSRQLIVDRYEQKYVWNEILKFYNSLN